MRRAWCAIGASMLWACGGNVGQGSSRTTAVRQVERAPTCAAAVNLDAPRPLGSVAASSSVALARTARGKPVAYVADADTQRLYTVDVESLAELSSTALSGEPSGVLLSNDGRVFVAIRDQSRVAVLEPQRDLTKPLVARCEVSTPTEPTSLAWTPNEREFVVTSAWGRTLTAFDAESFERQLEVELPRDPRSVVVSDDGSKAYVSHATGSRLSVVHLKRPEARFGSMWLGTRGEVQTQVQGNQASVKVSSQRFANQGYALAKAPESTGRILAPQVLVDRGNVERRTSSGYSEARLPQMPSVAVIDEDAGAVLASSLDDSLDPAVNLGWGEPQVEECLLPRVALVDSSGQDLYVGCFGIDQVVLYDAMSADPRRAERKRWGVPAGPTGLAMMPESGYLVVWSQFDRTLSVIDTRSAAAEDDPLTSSSTELVLSRPASKPMRGDVALGRKLFHAIGNLEIAQDGRSCASCHIDGRDDGLTWATPDGPRQTPVLMGRLTGTAPFGWTGNGEKLVEHMEKTFARLGGKGLDEHELGALMAYIASLEPPDERFSSARGVQRGKDLFYSARTGCSTCHAGDKFTDGERHDVRSAATGDKTKGFDTPSLVHIGASAPYFHDGRFATLRDMLDSTSGMMGKTSHLSESDKDALVAYLKTL